jgi:hypothetical protein
VGSADGSADTTALTAENLVLIADDMAAPALSAVCLVKIAIRSANTYTTGIELDMRARAGYLFLRAK